MKKTKIWRGGRKEEGGAVQMRMRVFHNGACRVQLMSCSSRSSDGRVKVEGRTSYFYLTEYRW